MDEGIAQDLDVHVSDKLLGMWSLLCMCYFQSQTIQSKDYKYVTSW